jgi:hypothetical protein
MAGDAVDLPPSARQVGLQDHAAGGIDVSHQLMRGAQIDVRMVAPSEAAIGGTEFQPQERLRLDA